MMCGLRQWLRLGLLRYPGGVESARIKFAKDCFGLEAAETAAGPGLAFEFGARGTLGPGQCVHRLPGPHGGVLVADERGDGVSACLCGPESQLKSLPAVDQPVPRTRLLTMFDAA